MITKEYMDLHKQKAVKGVYDRDLNIKYIIYDKIINYDSLHEYDFSNTVLSACIFKESTIDNCILNRTLIMTSVLVNVSIINCDVDSLTITASEKVNIRFYNCKIKNLNIRNPDNSKVIFDDCEIRDTDFSMHNISSWVFNDCIMVNVYFRRTNMCGTQFNEVDIANTNFYHALYDAKTLLNLGISRRIEFGHYNIVYKGTHKGENKVDADKYINDDAYYNKNIKKFVANHKVTIYR